MMADENSSALDYSGMIAYVLFLVGSVFVGPLEAVFGLAVYWLFGSDETESTSR